MLNLPIANRERHCVTNKNDGHNGISTKVVVAIDQIIDADDQTHDARRRQRAHGEDEAKPVDAVLRSYTPEDQGCWDTNDADHKRPQAMLSFHYAVVATRESDGEPVAQSSCYACCDDCTEAAREVANADHCGLEVISGTREDDGCSRVENVEPDEVRSVRKASEEDDRPSKELERASGMASHTLTWRRLPQRHLLKKCLRLGILYVGLVSFSDLMLSSLRSLLRSLAIILIARSGRFDLRSVDVSGDADVVRFFHEEEQKHKDKSKEDRWPVEDPLPALVLGDEAGDDGREVVAAC